MYTILYHPDVISDDLFNLDNTYLIRIKKVIEERLKIQPEKFGIYLRNDLAGYLKLRVGDYRIIFRIESNKKIVKIFMIKHRSVAYKLIYKRI